MIRTALGLALLVSATAGAAEIVPLSGKPFKGSVVGLDAQFLTIKDEAGNETKVSIKELSAVELGSKAPTVTDLPHDEIELTDGSLIRSPQGATRIKLKKIEPGTLPGPTGTDGPVINVPLDSIFTLLRDAHKPLNKTDWKKLLSTRGKRDLFVIREKRDSGEVLSQLEGTVVNGNEAGDRITFEQTSGEKSDFLLARATGGIVFNPPTKATTLPTLCKVVDVFGNVLIATSVEFAGSGLKVATVSGATVEYKTLAAVAKLDFSQGNLLYLSELEPEIEAPKAVEGEPRFTFTKNKTAMGLPLRLDGKTFAKGLWIYPETTLKYKLSGDYKTFRVIFGIDESVQIATCVVKLTIEADGRSLFSGTVSRKDKAVEKLFDVKDVKELKITVDRDSLYTGGQIDLGDARLQK